MIMFTITRPKRKLKKFLGAAALVLLLGVVVPGVYFTLSGVGAMSLFASGEAIGGEAGQPPAGQAGQIEQAGQTEPEKAGFLSDLHAVFFGEPQAAIPY